MCLPVIQPGTSAASNQRAAFLKHRAWLEAVAIQRLLIFRRQIHTCLDQNVVYDVTQSTLLHGTLKNLVVCDLQSIPHPSSKGVGGHLILSIGTQFLCSYILREQTLFSHHKAVGGVTGRFVDAHAIGVHN